MNGEDTSMMNGFLIRILAIIAAVFLFNALSVDAMQTTVIDLGDETTEYVQIGYSNNPKLENLEYWFSKNGITDTDGSALNPLTDQSQAELFYTDSARQYEVEYLGVGYAAYHSRFGVFTYSGNPYEQFDKTKMTYYNPLFIQNEVATNTKYTFSIAANTYFGFYLDSNGKGTKLTTMVANNPKPYSSSKVQNKADYTLGFDNAMMFATNKGYTIAFEDIVGGGDADWEDLMVNFKPTDASGFVSSNGNATPEPATVILMGIGMIGLAGYRKFRNN